MRTALAEHEPKKRGKFFLSGVDRPHLRKDAHGFHTMRQRRKPGHRVGYDNGVEKPRSLGPPLQHQSSPLPWTDNPDTGYASSGDAYRNPYPFLENRLRKEATVLFAAGYRARDGQRCRNTRALPASHFASTRVRLPGLPRNHRQTFPTRHSGNKNPILHHALFRPLRARPKHAFDPVSGRRPRWTRHRHSVEFLKQAILSRAPAHRRSLLFLSAPKPLGFYKIAFFP